MLTSNGLGLGVMGLTSNGLGLVLGVMGVVVVVANI
jgi:hypothetical protein